MKPVRGAAPRAPAILPAAALGAEIEVYSAISLPGFGAVLIGHVRAGATRAGQLTRPIAFGTMVRRLEVISVERLSSMESGDPAVGLVFRNPPRLDELRSALPEGSILRLDPPGDPQT